MQINSYFHKIFVINLDQRADKWKGVVPQLDIAGITNFERFSGIKPDISTVPKEHYECIAAKNHSDGPDEAYVVGAMGCKLSHVGVVKLAKERGYKRVLIFEDDIIFRPNPNEVFTRAVAQLQTLPKWDMLYFTGNHGNRFTKVSPNLIRLQGSHSTVGYAIRENMYDEIIDNVWDYPYHIDLFYKDKLHPKFTCYCIMPHVVWNAPGFSDIEQGHRSYNVLKKHL